MAGSWTLFFSSFLLLQKLRIDAGHVSENITEFKFLTLICYVMASLSTKENFIFGRENQKLFGLRKQNKINSLREY